LPLVALWEGREVGARRGRSSFKRGEAQKFWGRSVGQVFSLRDNLPVPRGALPSPRRAGDAVGVGSKGMSGRGAVLSARTRRLPNQPYHGYLVLLVTGDLVGVGRAAITVGIVGLFVAAACADRSPRTALSCISSDTEPNWLNFKNTCSEAVNYRLCSTTHLMGIENKALKCKTGSAPAGKYFEALASSKMAGAARWVMQACFPPQKVTPEGGDQYGCQ